MPKRNRRPKQAETADRHKLYEQAVQEVESEIDFVDETFEELRGRKAASLREDFCGTAQTTCEWVRRRGGNTGVGVDLDEATLDWSRTHNIAALDSEAQARITLRNMDVRKIREPKSDIVLAMNFSYYIFKSRKKMRKYFRNVRKGLRDDGIFFLDAFGGYEAFEELEEPRECEGFTYVWDQHYYNPITGDAQCRIHFEFDDGSRMEDAFIYDWRLWTLPEIREVLEEAGFEETIVYWEGPGDDGEGDGIFVPTEDGTADAGWVAYIAAIPPE